MTVKINTALSLQRDMVRYWQTDVGAFYAVGCAEVARYANTPSLLPDLWNIGGDDDRVALAANLTHRTQSATTYWTKSEMVELTRLAAQGRPGSAIFLSDMPHMHGFCVFEEPMLIDMAVAGQVKPESVEDVIEHILDVHDKTNDDEYAYRQQELAETGRNNVNLAGFQWNQNSVNGVSGVDVILYSSPSEKRDDWIKQMLVGAKAQAFRRTPPLLLLGSFFIPFGEDFDEDDVWHSIVATWWHLIMQPISSTSVQQANPQMTKKARKLEIIPEISVITLRPRRPAPRDDDGNRKIVDWSHRWLVGAEQGGFWRMQWYPSLGMHKPIFIHMYEKGPLDKPLVIRRKRIYAWRR